MLRRGDYLIPTTDITFKNHGVTSQGVILLDAKEVQEVVQTMHSNFESSMQELTKERDDLIAEVNELNKLIRHYHPSAN